MSRRSQGANGEHFQMSAVPPGSKFNVGTRHVCKEKYTEGVRYVTKATKEQIYREYGVPVGRRASYVIDHLIPLELGGSNGVTNLWPEEAAPARAKDQVEHDLNKRLVCAEAATL